MIPIFMQQALAGLAVVLAAGPAPQVARAGQSPDLDPALRAAVERFFATQEQEDVQGYLSLWSESEASPQRERMLKFVFSGGDDRFSDITIVRVTPQPDGARVRVSATRDRTERGRSPDAPSVTRRSRMLVALTYAREGTEWKLLREAPAADDLALALLEAESPDGRAALLAADRELVSDRVIAAMSSRGTEAAQQQNYPLARDVFARVLEVARHLGNREAEGDALQNLGNAFYFMRNLPAALDAYSQRLTLERDRGNDAGVAAAQSGIAVVRYSYAEYGGALEAYREALAIQERLGELDAVATTLISTGNVLYLQGDYTAAVRDYTRSRAIARRRLDTFGESRALEGLGRVLMARGDYAAALQAFTGVLEEGRARRDANRQGTASLNLGEAHFRLGNIEAARAAFEESRAHFGASKDLPNAGRAWQSMGLLELAVGRFPQAEESYRQSSATCGTAADQDCVAGATVGLAFAQAAQDRFGEAIATYRKGIDLFTALRRPEPAARAEVGLAAALLGSREFTASVGAAARARSAAVALENDDVLWRAYQAEARALRRLGQGAAALEAVRAAASAVQRLLQTASLRPSTPVARDSSAVHALQAILEAEAGDAAAAFESAERLRVHELRVTLTPAEREITRGMTDDERHDERTAVAEIVSWHAQLTRERGLPKPDPARLERLRKGLDEATAARTAQQQRLFTRVPDLQVWRGVMPPVLRADLESFLAASSSTKPAENADAVAGTSGTLLLQFVVDEHDLLVLWCSAGSSGAAFSTRVVPLTRRALAERVASLMQQENLQSVESWRKASSGFFSVLPEPLVEALARSERTIIVPHEVLWRVPFEAIVLEDRYVADATLISYAHSMASLIRPPSPPVRRPDAAPVFVGAGAPRIAKPLQDFVAQTMPGWTLRVPEAAERELAQIGAGLPPGSASVALHEAATESALRTALSGADVIHLAVPFRINSASPLFSPLLCAGEPAAETVVPDADGTLELKDVMNLPLRARITVLSDGSAMSMRDAADDAATVYWGWRAAGVPALLLPRWTASEGAPDLLLAEVHRRVGAGQAPAEALGAARAAVRANETFAAPAFWAGWLLIGR